jgi:hypothetical protein
MAVNVLTGRSTMIAQSEVAAKNGTYPESDAKYRSTRAIDFWEVVKTPHFGSRVIHFRIRVTYPDGNVRTLAGAFADRRALDDYIARWLPTLAGKEKTS